MPTKHKSRIICKNSLVKKLDNFVSRSKNDIIKKVKLFFSTNSVSFLFKLDIMRKIDQNLLPELFTHEDPSLLLKNLSDQFHVGMKDRRVVFVSNLSTNFFSERGNIVCR